MTFGLRVRMAAYRWHCLVARMETATRLYVSTVAAMSRLVPSRRLRDLVEWAVTGQCVPWQPLGFAPRTIVVGNRTQIKLVPHLGEFDQAVLFRRQLDYEVPVFTWLERRAAKRYDAVIEIGANIGVYSVFFDALIRKDPQSRLRRVYAFEPSRRAYGRLLANLRANAAQSVEPFGVAISDETGFSQFYEPDGHLTNGSLVRGFAEQFSPTVSHSMVVTLAGTSLTELFARHERVLLKIDAEGLEARILAAMAPVLERYRPDLLIEVLEGLEAHLQALACLGAYGYFRLTAEGPSRQDTLTADPIDRDWLLTMSPHEI